MTVGDTGQDEGPTARGERVRDQGGRARSGRRRAALSFEVGGCG